MYVRSPWVTRRPGPGGLGGRLEKKLKQLTKKMEQDAARKLELDLLEDERQYAREIQILTLAAQEEEGKRQEEIREDVMKYVPWVLGGTGLLLTAGVVLAITRPKKKRKKKKKGRKR